jgi:hypothetical protein
MWIAIWCGEATNEALNIEPELDDVPVGHHVILAFQPHFASSASMLHRPGRNKIVERNDFGSDEAFLKVAVDDAGGLWSRSPLTNRPGS